MRLTARRLRVGRLRSRGGDGLGACAPSSPEERQHRPTGLRPHRRRPRARPRRATLWGPTEAEIAEAHDLVADWTPEQLAGQVIVGRYFGTDPAEAASLVRDLHLAGMCVTSANVTDEAQVLETTRAISDAVASDGRGFPAVVGVDEEGGVVAHLRGIATTFPAFQAAAGVAPPCRGGRAGRKAVLAAARASGSSCASSASPGCSPRSRT